MKKLLLLIIVSLVLAGVANAANRMWFPAGSGIFPPDVGNWGDAANWWEAGPVPTTDDIVTFGAEVLQAECRVTDAQVAGQLLQGNNWPGGVVRIRNGGTLTSGTSGNPSSRWPNDAVGYNDTAKMIVERGGRWESDAHHVWGYLPGGDGIVEINGGTIYGEGFFVLGGWSNLTQDPCDYGQCKVYINAGELSVFWWSGTIDSIHPVFWNDSLLDISFGKMVLRQAVDRAAEAQAYIDAGYITGFGQVGGAEVVYDAETGTTITASISDPLARTPTYDDVAWNQTLSWINLPPNSGSDVWVDVYFGTDMTQDANGIYADFTKIVDAGMNTTTAGPVSAPTNGEYLWRVATYLDGDPAVVSYGTDFDPNTSDLYPDEGFPLVFFATDDFPPSVAIDTLPTATWKNEAIQLNATVTDDGTSTVIYAWTSDEPNAVFKDPGTLLEDNTIEDPTVTVNYNSGAFNVTVEVSDSNPMGIDDSDTLGLDCRQSACMAGRYAVGLADTYPADVAINCEHDLADFAIIAADWLNDYTLTEATVIP